MNCVLLGLLVFGLPPARRAAVAAAFGLLALAGHALAQNALSAFGYTADNPLAVGVACGVAAFVQASKERQVGRRVQQRGAWAQLRLRLLDALGAAMLVYIFAGFLHLLHQTHPVWLALGMAAVGFAPGGATEALFVWVFRRGEGLAKQRADDAFGPVRKAAPPESGGGGQDGPQGGGA